MRFKSARVENFKLLKDVEVSFSTDSERPLTVIRAENASGKTSALAAFKWGLYGPSGLEDRSLRLSPIDWPSGEVCKISVEIDFSHTDFEHVGDQWVTSTEEYRLIRTATERISDEDFSREPDRVSLFRLTDEGTKKVESPDSMIAQMLSVDLMDVFFTDGDAAMNFISPQLTTSNKRDQVRNAIKSLLGLGLLEDMSSHLRQVKGRFTKAIGKASGSVEVKDISEEVEQAERQLDECRVKQKTVSARVDSLMRQYTEADKALQESLQLANQQELASRRRSALETKKKAEQAIYQYKVTHAGLFQTEALSWGLIRGQLLEGYKVLEALHDQGVIPRTAVPVLEDRLALGRCICGASLRQETAARAEVEALIEQQRSVDEERELLTILLHETRRAAGDSSSPNWVDLCDTAIRNRLTMEQLRDQAASELQHCEEQLRQLDHSDIEAKRQHRDSLLSALNENKDQRRDLEIEDSQLATRSKELGERFSKLTAANQKIGQLRGGLLATEDLLRAVDGALTEVQRDYLCRVSDRMNHLFLEMVGVDPEQSSVITGTSISSEYDIVVHAVGDRVLHPDHELNGASKRALTLAFIWALTEVSEALAPRVIDTPLGMMSGPVKKRVLQMVSKPADTGKPPIQVILFLTRSEVAQTEDILDERAGIVTTLTNTMHYPKDLVNDPKVYDHRIITCSCDHRHVCEVCQRVDDEEFGLVFGGIN